MSLDTIKKQCAKLSADELTELRSYLGALQSLNIVPNVAMVDVTPNAAASPDIDMPRMFLEAICALMRSRGVDFTNPAKLRKMRQYGEFKQKIDDGLGTFMREATDRNRIAMRALIDLSVRLLHDNLTGLRLPISAGTMMNHIHRIPAVLNAAFPGYAAAGMLHLVIRKE